MSWISFLSLFRFLILCLLALVCVLVVPSGFVAFAQDEIPSTQFEAISWLENERNTVKRDANGDVVEIIIDYVPDIFVIGDLEIFPKQASTLPQLHQGHHRSLCAFV